MNDNYPMKIKQIISRLILCLSIVIVLIIGLVVIPYFTSIVMPWDRASAIESTIAWGGLAEIPDAATELSVDKEGSMFTREFIIEFELDTLEMNEWIQNSFRIKNAEPLIESDGTIKYEIYPGEDGALGGTVRINKSNKTIEINMSFS